MQFDVCIVGAGMSGVTAALILANSGLSVVLVDSHVQPGGCAGYFVRSGLVFDVGATTFVSFQSGGIAEQVFSALNVQDLPLQRIREYSLCLPDRTIVIPDNWESWGIAWAKAFPELGSQGRPFFENLAALARRGWNLAGRLPTLPIVSFRDFRWCLKALSVRDIQLLYWMLQPFEAWISAQKVKIPSALRAAFNMLLQDTVQTSLQTVPALFAFLGLTLMPYGLFRAPGGSKVLWDRLMDEFYQRGGIFKPKHKLIQVEKLEHGFNLRFDRGREDIRCRSLISAIPVWNMQELAPQLYGSGFDRYLKRKSSLDSAFSLFTTLSDKLPNVSCNHFQVLSSFETALGNGNNFLLSMSEGAEFGDAAKKRAITFSTHTDPHYWSRLGEVERQKLGMEISEKFLVSANRVLPGFSDLIDRNLYFPAGPHTYARFTGRYLGMAGNQALTLGTSGINSIPQEFGTKGFYQTGDTTFPGVGTVSCVLSAATAARKLLLDMQQADPFSHF
jgi:phytoene dehydrogenase-like protein